MSKFIVLRRRTILLAVPLILGVAWLGLEASQWLFRIRAETLLADIKSLQLNHSSWSDAQRLMNRWGRWGGWYENCGAEECQYEIKINHLSLVSPDFVFEEGPHLYGRILELLGLRSATVTATFHVMHGVITNKGFGVEVALPISKWITPGGGFWLKDIVGSSYWPSLDVATFEGAKLRGANPFFIAKHPNRGFIHRRIRLEASFTPEESLSEQAALMDFHFDCITRWTACTSREELLPRAVEESEADERELLPLAAPGSRSLHQTCLPTLDVRAREERDVLLADVIQTEVSRSRASDDSLTQGSWIQLMRLREVLKGNAPVRAGGDFRVIVSCNDGQGNCNRLMTHSQVILTGTSDADKANSERPDFDASKCGVAEATRENLAAARNGIQQDFGPRY